MHATKAASETTPVWEQDMPKDVQDSIDRLVDYMIGNNISPQFEMGGNIVLAFSEIVSSLKYMLPNHLQDDIKTVFDYLAVWICEYATQTSVKNMTLKLGFRQGGAQS